MNIEKQDSERIEKIGLLKQDISPEELCENLPSQILKWFSYSILSIGIWNMSKDYQLELNPIISNWKIYLRLKIKMKLCLLIGTKRWEWLRECSQINP